MNFRVKCNRVEDSYDGFSVGKVYEVKEGKIVDNEGTRRPLTKYTILSLSDLDIFYGKFDFTLTEEALDTVNANDTFYITLYEIKDKFNIDENTKVVIIP